MIQRFKILWTISFAGFILLSQHVVGQVIIGAKGASLGNANTALNEDKWAVFSNPASIPQDDFSIGFYSLRYYGFPEITDVSSVVNFEFLKGYSALGFYRFGDNLYSETNINLGYKYSWMGVNTGISVQYRHLSFGKDYGAGSALSISIGFIAKIQSNINFGVKIRNVNRGTFNFQVQDEELPQDISVGMTYKLEEKALFVFDVFKDVRFPVSYRGGVDVEIVERIYGRIGATYDPLTFTFGMGYALERWQFNLVVQQHEILGISPGLDIIINL